MSSSSESVTALIAASQQGDDRAFRDLFALLYDELQRLARTVRKGRASETLNTTALVHESYLRLSPADLDLQDRQHVLRIAAKAMRHVLVYAARRRSADKRGGDLPAVTFVDEAHGAVPAGDVLALSDALDGLERLDARQAQVVELRVFGGLTVDETAEALGLSAPTVYRDWRAARAWLARELQPEAS